MNKIKFFALSLILGLSGLALFLLPELALASLEGSLQNLRTSLVRTVLPLLAVIGMCFAAISFFLGSPRAKEHFYLALMGAFIAFGGQSLVDWVSSIAR